MGPRRAVDISAFCQRDLRIHGMHKRVRGGGSDRHGDWKEVSQCLGVLHHLSEAAPFSAPGPPLCPGLLLHVHHDLFSTLQAGIVVFFAGLFISWASSWSSPPPAPSPAQRSKESPEGREVWEELPAGDVDVVKSPQPRKAALPRSRRESLWEEAEIDRLDFKERTGSWEVDSIEQGRTPPLTRSLGGQFRRGSAMSLLHQLLGQEQGSESGGVGWEDGRVSPCEAIAHSTVSICTGVEACAVGTEVTLRSPKNMRGSLGSFPLLPPPSGPRI
jgi:hypothetical protein